MDTASICAIAGAAVAVVILLALFIYSMRKNWQEISLARVQSAPQAGDRTQVTALEQGLEPASPEVANPCTSTPTKDAPHADGPALGFGNQGFNETPEESACRKIEVEMHTPVNGVAKEADSTTAL